MRGRLAAWRYRWQLYRRIRWTDASLQEVETGIMFSAVILGIVALLIVLGRNG